MQIGLGNIIVYAIFGLTVALAVNYYGDLNIPIINKIQNVLIPGLGKDINGENPKGRYSYSPTDGSIGCANAKVFGETKRQLRREIKAAKAKGNLQRTLDLKQRFGAVEEQERQACQ